MLCKDELDVRTSCFELVLTNGVVIDGTGAAIFRALLLSFAMDVFKRSAGTSRPDRTSVQGWQAGLSAFHDKRYMTCAGEFCKILLIETL